MIRDIPDACEVCGLIQPVRGVGFPTAPGVIPGLPDHLRGACLWICHALSCDLAAQKRAATAAAGVGITLSQIWRVHAFSKPATKERADGPVR